MDLATGPVRKSFYQLFVQTFGSQAMAIIVNVISGIIVSRNLGPEGKGLFVTVMIWSNLLINVFGFSIYRTSTYFMKVMKEEKKDVFAILIRLSFGFGTMAFLVAELIVVPFVMSGHNERMSAAAAVYFLVLLFGPVTEMIYGALAAEERFKYANMLRVLFPTVSTIGMALLLVIGQLTAVSAMYINFSVVVGSGLLTLHYAYRQRFFGGSYRKQLLKPILTYTFKLHGGSVSSVASGNVAQIMMSTLMPPAVIGIYSTAQSTVSPLTVFPNSIGYISMTRLAGMSEQETHQSTLRIWKASLMVSVTMAFLIALLLPFMLPFVYGQSFAPAVLPATVLLANIVIGGQCTILNNALCGVGRPIITTKSELTAFIVIMACLPFALPLWGPVGAASVAVTASCIRLILYMSAYSRYIHKFSFRDWRISREDAENLIKQLPFYKLQRLFNVLRRRSSQVEE